MTTSRVWVVDHPLDAANVTVAAVRSDPPPPLPPPLPPEQTLVVGSQLVVAVAEADPAAEDPAPELAVPPLAVPLAESVALLPAPD